MKRRFVAAVLALLAAVYLMPVALTVPFLPDTLITRFFAVSRQKEHSGTIVCSLWSGRGL